MLHKIRTVRTRMLSTMMAIIMLMSLIPVTASADGEGTVPTNGGALSGNYKLTGDVTLTAPLTVAAGENVTIDLNGHDISYSFNGSETCSLIDNDGTLTLTDTSEGKNGSLVLTGGEGINKYAYIQAVSNDGNFTLSGGTLKVTANYACWPVGIRTSAASAVTTINGGNIWVEKTAGTGKVYGIYSDQSVNTAVNLLSGDITVKNVNDDAYGISVKGGSTVTGKVTLSGGSLSSGSQSGKSYGVYTQYSGLDMTGTEVTVSAATNGYGIYCANPNDDREVSGGSVKVKGNANSYGIHNYIAPNIPVKDCTVEVLDTNNAPTGTAATYCDISGGNYTAGSLANCTVTGGTFSFNPSAFLKDPFKYQAQETESGKWTVVEEQDTTKRVENKNTGETYSNLKAAVDVAIEDDTLVLLEDCDVRGQQVKITQGITIDLNGQHITSTPSINNVISISGGTEEHPVVITDSAATSTSSGIITSPTGISISGSSVVTLKNIDITGTSQCISYLGNSFAAVTLCGVSLTAENSSGVAYGVNASLCYGGTIDVYNSTERETTFEVSGTPSSMAFSNYFATINVYGGKFNVDPQYVANGYTAQENNGIWTVSQDSFATVNDTAYNSLQSAVNAAIESDMPIVLTTNATVRETVTLPESVAIEDNGHSLTITAEPAVIAAKGVQIPAALGEFEASSVLSDGRIAYYAQYGNAIAENDNVTLLKDLTIAAPINSLKDLTIDLNGHNITRNDDDVAAFSFTNITGGTADIEIINTASKTGTIHGNVEVKCGHKAAKYSLTIGENVAVTGDAPLTLWGNDNSGCITVDVYGTLTSKEEAAIQGNGTDGQGGTVINIHEGAVVDGGSSVGIYHPQAGVLNISGGEVKGATALYMRSGTLNITGGNLTANGAEANHDSIDEQSGYGSTGDALVVDSSNYPGGAPVVNITDGEFISEQAKPVASYITNQAKPVTGFVKGGNFSKSLATDLLDASLKYELNDTQDNPNAPISYYSTIQAAADAAKGNLDAVIQTTGAANTDSTATYTVTFRDGASGTEYNIKATHEETITLPTPTRSGYTLLGWYEDSTRVGSGGASYQVTKNVTLEAKWTLTPTTSDTPSGSDDGYSISVPSSSSIRGGSITVSPRSAEKGDKIAITLKPDSGYELDKLLVTDGSGRSLKLTQESANRYTFTMPASRVDIEVSFKIVESAPVNPFVDVSKSDYYYDAVLWAVENGVTSGTSATTFGPNVTVTRGQMMTFLWRAHGSPKVTGSNPFTDISASDYYYNAVLWAVKNGITSGTSATTFDPNAAVTRSQAVTFQWRAAGSTTASGSSFADVAADTWYADAVAWAVSNGITSGIGGNNFGPDVAVSRAQAVTFLYREQE